MPCPFGHGGWGGHNRRWGLNFEPGHHFRTLKLYWVFHEVIFNKTLHLLIPQIKMKWTFAENPDYSYFPGVILRQTSMSGSQITTLYSFTLSSTMTKNKHRRRDLNPQPPGSGGRCCVPWATEDGAVTTDDEDLILILCIIFELLNYTEYFTKLFLIKHYIYWSLK